MTIAQLERALHIRQTIDKLQDELNGLFNGVTSVLVPNETHGRKKANRSQALSSAKASSQGTKKKARRKMSAAGRARIAAAQKERWAKVKAATASA